GATVPRRRSSVQAPTLLRRRGTVAPVGGLVGESEAMEQVYALIERLAPTDLPVLITGPSGSGKDLVARALHARSRRADGPLVIENVSALPAHLLESELFGHLRGAFTGADRDRPGLFAEAHGGTFFLDEIGEMPIELQSKLLRVLESGEVRAVGSRKPVRVDVRIIAATNRELPARVLLKAFREDLYYRLNAAEIRMPALAERLEDIPLLVRHFLERLNAKHGTDKDVTEEVLATLVRRPWPGQVRELGNEVSRLYFLSDDRLDQPRLVRAPPRTDDSGGDKPSSLQLEEAERAAIVRALAAAGGRKDRAARLLGISRAGLYAKLKRLAIAAGD
ncbi:MAG TPA: sigma-54 dependent transcriptional regulator, partial [Planctomycetota bacterium]|nr:sigma-54 dependent transcriptional regulator [Planctomycetota bacterium]